MAARRSFSDRLRTAREIAQIPARELDRLAQLAEGHTALIERGERPRVELETAQKLSQALGVSLEWLASGTGDRPEAKDVLAAVGRARAAYERRNDAA